MICTVTRKYMTLWIWLSPENCVTSCFAILTKSESGVSFLGILILDPRFEIPDPASPSPLPPNSRSKISHPISDPRSQIQDPSFQIPDWGSLIPDRKFTKLEYTGASYATKFPLRLHSKMRIFDKICDVRLQTFFPLCFGR